VQEIASNLGRNAIQEFTSKGAHTVEIKLTNDKSEQTLVIKNAQGEILGNVPNTTRAAVINNPFSLSWQDIYEAFWL